MIGRRIRTALRRSAAPLVSLSLLAGAIIAPPSAAQAQTPARAADASKLAAEGLVTLEQVNHGALLLKTDKFGWYVPAPALDTSIKADVSGPIARIVVTQKFRNVAKVFVEGKYVFPMPEGAAVDTLKMRVGDRWIEGKIEERKEAKKIYEEAKAEGKVASLVEQERPNMFTTSVANIAPGAVVVVQIEYQETLAPREGAFGLRLPLVVAPRYSPKPTPVQLVKFGPEGWYEAKADPVPDRERITPPVVDPRSEEKGTLRNPVDIVVDIEAGFPLGRIKSLYHGGQVKIEPRGVKAARVTLTGPIKADRDFFLSWRPAKFSDPYAAAFTEERDGESHYVAMLTPPDAAAIGDTRRPREVIFVQDVSGSMGGESITQARAGLEMALKRLSPDDTFNIIIFNDKFAVFEENPVPATPENIARAVESVRALQATGGTEMLPALEVALKDASGAADGRVRQVVFLTDGAVGNERQMLKLISKELGRNRLFTVGIGSAPNSYFMTAAARAGRGAHVFIGDLKEVRERMETLFTKIETPAVVDMTITALKDGRPVANAQISPTPAPDLYAGDPVVATVRLPAGVEADTLRFTGLRGDAKWEMELPLSDARKRPGVSKLWARETIRDLEALRLSPDVTAKDQEKIDADILKTALDFGIVSRLTSLVAVDVKRTRPADEKAVRKDVPLNLPAGWDPEIFFESKEAPVEAGEDAPALLQKTALTRLTAAAKAREAARAAKAAAKAKGLAIPDTGADWMLRGLAGLALLLFGLVLWRVTRRSSAA
ncbi:MAG: marine proteobacterial sortase target protein [Neomegalonema sp.]|nr:marine proteobacterial sortase target protein [Neomegalonema sp.]